MDLALEHQADCGSYVVGGKTLLQQLLRGNNNTLLEKVLTANSTNLMVSLLWAMGQNGSNADLLTIDKLLTYDSSLLKQKIIGYTPSSLLSARAICCVFKRY